MNPFKELRDAIRTKMTYEIICHGGHEDLKVVPAYFNGEAVQVLVRVIGAVDEDTYASNPIAILLNEDLENRLTPGEEATRVTPARGDKDLVAVEKNSVIVPTISSLN